MWQSTSISHFGSWCMLNALKTFLHFLLSLRITGSSNTFAVSWESQIAGCPISYRHSSTCTDSVSQQARWPTNVATEHFTSQHSPDPGLPSPVSYCLPSPVAHYLSYFVSLHLRHCQALHCCLFALLSALVPWPLDPLWPTCLLLLTLCCVNLTTFWI